MIYTFSCFLVAITVVLDFVIQDATGTWFCKTCPEGYFCNATFGPVVFPGAYVCPEGFYCPNGTRYAEEHPCPRGTFNNITGNI